MTVVYVLITVISIYINFAYFVNKNVYILYKGFDKNDKTI